MAPTRERAGRARHQPGSRSYSGRDCRSRSADRRTTSSGSNSEAGNRRFATKAGESAAGDRSPGATPDVALPAEDAYRAAVSDINAALQGSNVEAARAALRSLLGNIPVFQTGRQLAARLTINPGTLMRNPGNVLLIGSGGPIWDLFSPPEGEDQAHLAVWPVGPRGLRRPIIGHRAARGRWRRGGHSDDWLLLTPSGRPPMTASEQRKHAMSVSPTA